MASVYVVSDNDTYSNSQHVLSDSAETVQKCTNAKYIAQSNITTCLETDILQGDVKKLQIVKDRVDKLISEKQKRVAELKDVKRPLQYYKYKYDYNGYPSQLVQADSKEAVFQYVTNFTDLVLPPAFPRRIYVEAVTLPLYDQHYIDNKKREDLKRERAELQHRVEKLDTELKNLM